jgi:hypothetical protein
MAKNNKSEDTIQIMVSKEVQDQLDSIVNMLTASGSNGEPRYDRAIKYALTQAGLWDGGSRMNTSNDMFFCYDLGITLTADYCCHEDSCPYTAKCLLMKPLVFDTSCKKIDTANKNMVKKKFAET